MLGSSISLRRFALAALLLVPMAAAFLHAQDTSKRGRKYKAPPPTAHFVVTVTRATTGKPVDNASVIFHPLSDGHSTGNMELKTNDDGQATLDLLEIGSTVRVQILAPGFQTFGEDYKIDKDNIAVAVQLKRPAEQYSIYKKHDRDGTKDSDKNADPKPDADKPKADPKDTSSSDTQTAEPQKDAPTDSAQPDAKPKPDATPNAHQN